jgi:hypothetical protein
VTLGLVAPRHGDRQLPPVTCTCCVCSCSTAHGALHQASSCLCASDRCGQLQTAAAVSSTGRRRLT